MTIYPAIDIKGGRCVRLTQGRADQETIYAENPAEVAAQFHAAGSEWVHVVDLDGAFAGEPQNLAAVQAIAAVGMKVQLGGGLRTRAAVENRHPVFLFVRVHTIRPFTFRKSAG